MITQVVPASNQRKKFHTRLKTINPSIDRSIKIDDTKGYNSKLSEKDIREEKEAAIMKTIAKRCAFYRENPHRFCEDYLNLHLKLFQKMLLVMMFSSNYFMFWACRGLGKTFLTAIFCVVRCILYPGTCVCIASGKRTQAAEVIGKIEKELIPLSANLRNEISYISSKQQNASVDFFNGSRIKIVTATDSARGARANILICDEFRMIPQNIIQTVLRKFLTNPRQPLYLRKPEYQHLAERNKEIYMSSCWYQSHWSYEKAKAYTASMVDDKRKYFICGLPYQLAIKEGLLSREQVEDEMSESDFNSVTWMIEMECLFFGDTESGLYSYEDIEKTRQIKYAIYPKSDDCKLADKRLHIKPHANGEIRILSADIALMSSKVNNNDATSIFLNQMMPNARKDKYISNITYAKNQEGLRTDAQALSIRKLMDDFNADYLVIDARNTGLAVVDLLMADMYDPSTGDTYPALSCCNNKEIASRCLVPNAPKKIWVVMGMTEFNSKCALGLREAFKSGTIRLLASDLDFEENMQTVSGYMKSSQEDKVNLKLPFINTTLLTNELVSLEYKIKDSAIKVMEKSGQRKDRYSSLSYNIYVANVLEHEKKAQNSKKSVCELAMIYKAPPTRK